MTEKFYCDFLEYLSAKEKQKLFGYFQKRKVRVDGFRMSKDVPLKLLASHISRNEKMVFQILKDCYSPSYTDRNEAIQDFSPNTAVTCLTYFIQEKDIDEQFLASLLNEEKSSSSEPKPTIANNKAQKKSEEFRQKYLATYKELDQIKKAWDNLQSQNQKLQELLNDKECKLHAVEEELSNFRIQHDQLVTTLKQRISELEETVIEQTRISELQCRKILVLSRYNEQGVPGVTILQYHHISQLEIIAGDYSEILFVTNDVPFPVKRHIQKIEEIQDKIHTFSTHTELMEYIGNWRQK